MQEDKRINQLNATRSAGQRYTAFRCEGLPNGEFTTLTGFKRRRRALFRKP
jgi:hypothetical protein